MFRQHGISLVAAGQAGGLPGYVSEEVGAMAINQRSILALVTMLALIGAFRDGIIDFQRIIPLLILISVVPAWTRAEARVGGLFF